MNQSIRKIVELGVQIHELRTTADQKENDLQQLVNGRQKAKKSVSNGKARKKPAKKATARKKRKVTDPEIEIAALSSLSKKNSSTTAADIAAKMHVGGSRVGEVMKRLVKSGALAKKVVSVKSGNRTVERERYVQGSKAKFKKAKKASSSRASA